MNAIIGKPLPRVDGRAKVTGGARYAADFNQPGQAYAVIVGARWVSAASPASTRRRC